MDTVTSADGTAIAYERTGSGPPLVLVHGASVDHTTWSEVLPHLEREHTVYAVDRRGRGKSGDATEYDLSREVEDIVAVVATIDEPVSLLGHSFGGLCSLEAARHTDRLRRIVLYEPGILVEQTPAEARALAEMRELLNADDREDALLAFYRTFAALTDDEIAYIRSQPTWQRRVDAVHTSLREIETGYDYEFDPSALEELTTPTLLLVGEESPASQHEEAETLCDVLPDCRMHVLEGQQHVDYRMAPERFAGVVIEFFGDTA